MNLNDAASWATVIGGVAVICGFIGWLVKRALSTVVQQVAEHLDPRLEAMERKLDGVHHQTHLNGGGSLKDAVIRTEAKVQILTDLVSDGRNTRP